MDINVTIQAPDLAAAIQSLADAIVATGCIPVQVPEKITQAVTPNAELIQQIEIPAEQPVQQAVQIAPVYQAPVQQTAPAAPVQQTIVQSAASIPTSAPSYTMEQLAVAATQIMDAGRKNDLLQLLAQFGVQALTALPKEQYGNFATQLRGMGARI